MKKGTENIIGKGFDKNPQNINRKGPPRKSFNSFNLKCKDKGIEPVNREAYFNAVGNVMNLTMEEMKSEMADKNNPQWFIWLIQDLGDRIQRPKIMADYRDWMFGKAHQSSTADITSGGEKIGGKIVFEIIDSSDKIKDGETDPDS